MGGRIARRKAVRLRRIMAVQLIQLYPSTNCRKGAVRLGCGLEAGQIFDFGIYRSIAVTSPLAQFGNRR